MKRYLDDLRVGLREVLEREKVRHRYCCPDVLEEFVKNGEEKIRYLEQHGEELSGTGADMILPDNE